MDRRDESGVRGTEITVRPFFTHSSVVWDNGDSFEKADWDQDPIRGSSISIK